MKRSWPALLLLGACASTKVAAPGASVASAPGAALRGAAAPWRYDVAVTARARELVVHVEIPEGSWGDLEVTGPAEPFVRDAEVALGGASFQPLARGEAAAEGDDEEPAAQVFRLPACPAAGCRVRYRFALDEAARALDADGLAADHDGAILAPPSTWLLRPLCFPDEQPFRLRVTTPPGEGFATGLFRGRDGEITADLSDLPKAPFTAFGDLRLRTVDAFEERLQIATLPGKLDLDEDALTAWIQGSAALVHDYYRRAPAPSALLILLPTSGSGIGYGRTLGNGGASVILPIGEHSTASELARGWELTHELLHTGFPLLSREHAWLAEGLATYLEPLLRARHGIVAPEEALAHLYRRLPFGLASPGAPGLDEAPSWGRTYWGGALFCLLADVAIRDRTGGARSIDDALRAIVAEGGNVGARWPIARVNAVADAATGVPVFAELYAAQGLRAAPVDLAGVWRSLGVVPDGLGVRFDDGAPRAWIRRALVARGAGG